MPTTYACPLTVGGMLQDMLRIAPISQRVRPLIQTARGLQAAEGNVFAVTSPINTSGAASNALYANAQTAAPSASAPAPTLPAPMPLAPMMTLTPDDGTVLGLTPLGWGVVLVGAFAAYKLLFAKS